MILQMLGLFLLLIAISLGMVSGVCIACFRHPEVERRERPLSLPGFLKRPHDYLRRPFAGLAWGLGILGVICAAGGAVLLLLSAVLPA